MSAPPTARERLDELYRKLDGFFERAHARHPTGITCHAGCADCCHRRFSVTGIEASVIAESLAELPSATRRALAERALAGDPGRCPALDDDGRCAVYGARPTICRTHGLAIRFGAPTAPAGARALPMIDTCPRNFIGEDLGALDPASVLDQTTLSTILGALDAAHAGELGRARGERIEIAALLAAE